MPGGVLAIVGIDEGEMVATYGGGCLLGTFGAGVGFSLGFRCSFGLGFGGFLGSCLGLGGGLLGCCGFLWCFGLGFCCGLLFTHTLIRVALIGRGRRTFTAAGFFAAAGFSAFGAATDGFLLSLTEPEGPEVCQLYDILRVMIAWGFGNNATAK